jgi:carbonic anhydrase
MFTKYLLTLLTFVIGVVESQKSNYRSLYTTSLACEMGRLQSPLNLQDVYSNFNSSVNILYTDYVPIQNAYLGWSKSGRILQVNQKLGTPSTSNFGYAGLSRGGVIKQYALTGIEIYTPAEHKINGFDYDLEILLIHENVIQFQTNVNQYRRIPDGNKYLTISLLYSQKGGVSDNGFLKDLVSTWNGNSNPDYKTSSFLLDMNSYELIRDRRWFFYEGSFSYFPCDEVVNKIVIRDPFIMENLSLFQDIYKTVYDTPIVSKPISESNGRPIYRNYMNETEVLSGEWISTRLMFSLFLIWISILL